MTSRSAIIAALCSSSCLAALPEPQFRSVTISDSVQIGYGLAIADVDGDKNPDILLADKKQFVWYRNPGAASAADGSKWTRYVLAENLTEKDNVCIAAQDLDGDGKCEVAVGAEWNPGDTEKSGAVFYLIPPADRTQRWEAVKFPSVEPTTHRMKWIQLEANKWGLVVAPLHGRGNKNGEGAPVKILCYEKPADPKAEWPASVVDESLHKTHNFMITSIAPTPDRVSPSLAVGGGEGIRFNTYSNGKWSPAASALGKPEFGDDYPGAGELRQGKLGPGAGRRFIACVEPMHGNRLSVISFSDTGKATRQILTDQLAEGHALACGDLLGIGSDQIVVGWRGTPEKPHPVGIKLFAAADNTAAHWQESPIDSDGMACEDVALADLNGDGKLDIIASGRATHNLKVYLNETPAAK